MKLTRKEIRAGYTHADFLVMRENDNKLRVALDKERRHKLEVAKHIDKAVPGFNNASILMQSLLKRM